GPTCTTIIPINYGPIDPMSSCAGGPGGSGVPVQGWTGQKNPAGGDPAISLDNWGVSEGFKSNHPGGANFLFGDGSIQFLNQNIMPETYNKLGCRNDGKTLPPDSNY